jgi:TetR/AcrR family transcriptional regulator, mexJK operon transcriptional repressor
MPSDLLTARNARRRRPRRTWRGQERCERLRAVAAELFLARGYDSVSVDEIVRQVGGSKANVYSHFGGKEGLFVAVVEDLCEEILAPLAELDLAGLSLEAGLRTLARTLLDVLLQERHLAFHRLVVAEAGRFPELGRVWFARGPETAHRILAAFISAQQQAGRVRRIDPRRCATLFHDMLTFDLLHRAMMAVDGGPGPAEVDQVIDGAVDLFLRAYGTEGAAGRPRSV